LQSPKTKAAVREIDMTESVTAVLRGFIGDRRSGLLFKTKTGRALGQSNIVRRHLHPLLRSLGVPQTGFHAFRRFRATWLRKQGALEDLVKLWLGHAETSITDGYSKIKNDAAFRQRETERVGIGFEIPQSVSRTVRNVRKSEEAVAA
jgi:integrase